jgi:dTDP-4-amino-4,6-dideoxygalactose transaminase
MMIPFNIPLYIGNESDYVNDVIHLQKFSGDGFHTLKCHEILQAESGAKRALLTTSGTHALEMAAILCDIKQGDEVIMPSYTFVSTANAFVLRGAEIVFVDIRPDTMNIDEKLIESAITKKTKAVVPVHYAGVGCEMDVISKTAQEYNLFVVEDAAQGIGATYNGKPLGAIGDMGALSFHETKNISCGEGGALLIKNESFIERAEIIREKGTNRSKFFRGEIDKYTWCDIGSSYLPSELNAAFLAAQLEKISEITQNRLETWNFYKKSLQTLEEKGYIETAIIPQNCEQNAHMFWLKVRNTEERTKLLQHLKTNDVLAVFHYVPLHSSVVGLKFGRFSGEDVQTTKESERLIRLPMYYDMKQNVRERIIDVVLSFFEQ